MITTTQDYNDSLESGVRLVRTRFLLSGTEVGGDIITLKIHKGCCGDQITCGSVFATYIEASIRNCPVPLDGEIIQLQIGFAPDITDASVIDWATIGYYAVAATKKNSGAVAFTAFGTLAFKCGGEYTSALTYPATVSSIINEIQTATGITVTWQGVNNSFLSQTVAKKFEGISHREALGYIAGLCGGYVTDTSASGTVVIGTYLSGSYVNVPASRSQVPPEYSEDEFEVTGLSCTVKPEEPDETGESTIPAVVYTHGDPNVAFSNPYMTQTIFNNYCVPNFEGLQFYPASAGLTLGDCRLEGTDYIVITDIEGTERTVPCMTVTHECSSGLTSQIDAYAVTSDTEESAESGGQITQAINTILADSVNTKQAAARAQHSADEAAQAASDAQDSATAAADAASDAQEDADTANAAAHGALLSLETVQDVMGVLNWIGENAEYALTQDQSIVSGKIYYTVTGTAVTTPTEDEIKSYYEVSGGVYSKTTDATPVAGKTYYTLAGAVVVDPQSAQLSSYYELDVDAAMGDFVRTHVALTEAGLWLFPSKRNACRVLISTGQVSPYGQAGTYIIDRLGNVQAKFLEGSVQIGDSENQSAWAVLSSAGMTIARRGDNRVITIAQLKEGGWIFGTPRTTTDEYDPSENYQVGDLCVYGSHVYVCIEPTTGVWMASHWQPAHGGGFAEGQAMIASGYRAHAEGYLTTALGQASHCEGEAKLAVAEASHAEGFETIASGFAAHAEGDTTLASGFASHAGGMGTIAAKAAQTVIGRYNVEDTDSDGKYAFIIGNGNPSTHAPSNALTVDWDGNLYCANVGAAVSKTSAFSVSRSSGASTAAVNSVRKSGNMMMVSLKFTLTAAYTPNGTNIFTGTIPSDFCPAQTTTGIGYIRNVGIIGQITASGDLYIRPLAALSSGDVVYVYWTYFM